MSQLSNSKRQSIESINSSNPGGENEIERTTINSFIGKETFLDHFHQQLEQFEIWNEQRDWLAFHHHHYDWWMFPIDEISSRGSTYQLPEDVIYDLREDEEFIRDLRRGVRLMVRSWGWDIENGQLFHQRDDKQKWSYWPVRLYKAGKCMWLFGQDDYYQSLKKLAYHVRDNEKEKLDYFSHTKNGKADVLEQWNQMERRQFH